MVWVVKPGDSELSSRACSLQLVCHGNKKNHQKLFVELNQYNLVARYLKGAKMVLFLEIEFKCLSGNCQWFLSLKKNMFGILKIVG